MFGFKNQWHSITKCSGKDFFFKGLAFLSTLANINLLNAIPLNFISMSNQECKVRPQIVNVNSEESFLSLVLKQINAVVVSTISVIHTQNCVFLML